MNKCPKCGYERKRGDTECPQCGIVYEKYQIYIAKKQAEEDSKMRVEAYQGSKTGLINSILRERKILFLIVGFGAVALFIVSMYTLVPYDDNTAEQKTIEFENEQIKHKPEKKNILISREKSGKNSEL